jgi:hypothetical protein
LLKKAYLRYFARGLSEKGVRLISDIFFRKWGLFEILAGEGNAPQLFKRWLEKQPISE